MINGKSLSQVLQEVAVEEKPTKLLQNKFPYWSIEQYEQRLDRSIGREFYRASYEMGENITFPTGQLLMTVKCRISILDDSGAEVFYSEGLGGREATWSESNGSYISLGNLAGNARIQAFKDACKGMNIFNCHRFDETEEGGKKDAKKSGSEKKTAEVVKEFVTTSPLENVREDERTGKPVYRGLAHEVINKDKMRDEAYMIIFYPNNYAKCVADMNDYLMMLSDQKPHKKKMSVAYLKEVDGVKQYLFKGFA